MENVCNTLETHVELISLKPDGLSKIEHYGKDVDEKCNLGLAKGHYFINDYTELISYCLDNYEEIKDIKDCKKHLRNLTINIRGVMIDSLKHFKYLRY